MPFSLLKAFDELPFGSGALALLLSVHGLRSKSLSPSGAGGAFVVATIMMAVPLRIFGISCIAFYLLGSRATKLGKKRKGELEADHTAAGYRTIWQVRRGMSAVKSGLSTWRPGFGQRFFSIYCIHIVVSALCARFAMVQNVSREHRLTWQTHRH